MQIGMQEEKRTEKRFLLFVDSKNWFNLPLSVNVKRRKSVKEVEQSGS